MVVVGYLMGNIFDDEFSGGWIQWRTGLEAIVTEEAVDDAEAEDVAGFRFPLNDDRSVLSVRVFDDDFTRRQRRFQLVTGRCYHIRTPVGRGRRRRRHRRRSFAHGPTALSAVDLVDLFRFGLCWSSADDSGRHCRRSSTYQIIQLIKFIQLGCGTYELMKTKESNFQRFQLCRGSFGAVQIPGRCFFFLLGFIIERLRRIGRFAVGDADDGR